MDITKETLSRIVKEELRAVLREDGALFASKIDSLMKSGFDGILQIFELADSLGLDMPSVYRAVADKLYDLGDVDTPYMENFGYDYEGLERLFKNLVSQFGDGNPFNVPGGDFIEPKRYQRILKRFAAIKKELAIIDRDYNGDRKYDFEDFMTSPTYRQMTSTPQQRADDRGEGIVHDIADALDGLANRIEGTNDLREGVELPDDPDELFDLIYDSEPGDLIYYGIDGLNQMKAAIEEEIGEAEEEYHQFYSGYDSSWGEDNIVPLYKMYEKVEEAIKIAVDMGFG